MSFNIEQVISKGLNMFNEAGYSIVYFNVFSIFGINNVQFPAVIALILFSSVFFMFRLKFINIFQIRNGIHLMLTSGGHGGAHSGEQISPIKALFSVIAGAAGLGNIVGVTVAITVGGPGAAFWMIIIPFLTMPLRFAEVCIGHKFREQNADGSYSGGPSYYIRNGLAKIGLPTMGKVLAFTYALFLVVSGFGGGCSFQANQVVKIFTSHFEILRGQEVMVSLLFIIPVILVTTGGLKRISTFLSTMVPIMIGLYMAAALTVIVFNYHNIPESISVILSNAFDFKALSGGAFGTFIIATTRIVVATETGLGTAPVMHANSFNNVPAKEGIVAMASPVIDTLCVCLMSVLIVIVTGSYKSGLSGIEMTDAAFQTVAPWFSYLLMVMVPVMGINVVIAWSYYGMKNCQYLFGNFSGIIYRILFIICAFFGGIITNFDLVVRFTDIVNTSVAIPNIITLLLLSNIIAKEYFDYLKKNK